MIFNLLKRNFLIIWIAFFISCSDNHKEQAEHITLDFNLEWKGDKRNSSISLNHHHGEYGGPKLISETVVAYGFDEDFIIVKQHPNNWTPIYGRLKLDGDNYQLYNKKDADKLPSRHLSEEGGKIYLSMEGFEEAEKLLYPDETVTKYHIIDTRDYKMRFFHPEEKVHSFNSLEEFNKGREELGVSRSLDFDVRVDFREKPISN